MFREWLVFDSFILSDYFPISFFDKGTIGVIEDISDNISNSPADSSDYKQTDYSNITSIVLGILDNHQKLPVFSYDDLFRKYKQLNPETKEKIEWLVSTPYNTFSRSDAFFKIAYWQLVHLTILLEDTIGLPPNCKESFGTCPSCSTKLQPHYCMSRKEWEKQFLTTRISKPELVSEYVDIIEKARRIRNSLAHNTVFDRSEMPDLEPSETQTYDIQRALDEYKHDSTALMQLSIALSTICRYILLDVAFEISYYRHIPPIKVTRVGGDLPHLPPSLE
jgi:hypothetical protein